MPKFNTLRSVDYTAQQMFELVADIEKYPGFLPMCEKLEIIDRLHRGSHPLLIANMTIGYKFIQESFTTEVELDSVAKLIYVRYIDGPFKYLENQWAFTDCSSGGSLVHFYIDYEFKSRTLSALMGSVFEVAFRKFSEAFERRAEQLYCERSSEKAARFGI